MKQRVHRPSLLHALGWMNALLPTEPAGNTALGFRCLPLDRVVELVNALFHALLSRLLVFLQSAGGIFGKLLQFALHLARLVGDFLVGIADFATRRVKLTCVSREIIDIRKD